MHKLNEARRYKEKHFYGLNKDFIPQKGTALSA